jgi:diguanylate cyclase (GGDEF)-like protein
MIADAALALPLSPEERAASRRTHARRVQAFIMGSYCVDAGWMALLAMAGVLSFQVPLVFLMLFSACGVAFVLALLRGRHRHLADPYFTVLQMLVASTIQFGFMLWVPQIGLLLLTVLFIIVGFGGLRLKLMQAVFVSLWLAVGICLVVGLSGDRLSLPLASPAERIISAAWISSAVARAVMLGQYGEQLRKALIDRNGALNRAMEVSERVASRDGLTGALNRGSILKAIDVERQRMSRTGQAFAVVLLDLDHFKRVNDGFGHLVGDQVLIRVVLQIAAQMRATDDLGRYGGEEFLLLLSAPSGASEAQVVVERMLRAVQDYDWQQVAPGLAVTSSAGVALARADEAVLQMINRADNALYRAKNAGRNRVWSG